MLHTNETRPPVEVLSGFVERRLESVPPDWKRITDANCPLVLEQRAAPLSEATIKTLLGRAPFARRAEGDLAAVKAKLADLGADVAADISRLGERFMQLMRVDAIRVRVECVTTNACKKMHADYTDVRLITTYAGPGTDYAPHGDGECCLDRVPTGWVGLFKGRLFDPDHQPCLHRSPPIEGTGEARLVLVIDTPLRGPAIAGN